MVIKKKTKKVIVKDDVPCCRHCNTILTGDSINGFCDDDCVADFFVDLDEDEK